MAFRDMLAGGADCGPSNPLQNLLKHSDRDSQVQHDRMNSPGFGGGSAGPSMRSQGMAGSSRGGEDAERFFNGGGGPGMGGAFEMDALRRELEQARMAGGGSGGGGANMEAAWAQQFPGVAHKANGSGGITPEEFARMDHTFHAPSPAMQNSSEGASWRQEFNPAGGSAGVSAAPFQPSMLPQQGYGGAYAMRSGMGMGMGMGYGTMGGMSGMGGQAYLGGGGMNGMGMERPIEGKGKGKFVELSDANWEAEFAKIGDKEAEATPATAEAEATSTTDAKPTLEDLRNLAAEDGIDIENSETDDEFMRSLEATWKSLHGTINSASLEDSELAAWEAQYGSQFADPDWEADVPAIPHITPESVGDFLNNSTPYPFQAENPFQDHPDPFAEGQRLLQVGAPLSEAALAFEAACKMGENRAWRMLGETQAADEKEQLAIKAFEKAVEADPDGADAQSAWLSLAISWVNEGQELRALATLERWLQGSYPGVLSSLPKVEIQSPNPWDRHTRIVDMFLAAARAGPAARQGAGAEALHQQPVDADVQVGLGVLFYSNSDYDRARDCFDSALSVNPSDFLLWNRLGATLANGGSPETAIDAYRKALELRPTFTRAIYNLGVSCLNVGCFQEAAEHLLAALALHRRSGEVGGKGEKEMNPLLPDGDGSDNLWHTLRRAFLCLERPDLAERAKPGGDVESFRQDGFEF